MPLEIGGIPIPKTFEESLVQIRDRIKELTKQYGSLSRWGRPYLYSLKEVALIYWLNVKLGISLDRLASFLGVDKTALYKLVKKIEKEGKVSYYDPETNQVKTEYVSSQDLLALIEEELQPKAKMKITDIFQSSIVRKFWSEKIPKRAKIAGKPAYLNEKHKKETIRIIEKVMYWIKENKPDAPTNPDYWTEDLVEEALWGIYGNYNAVAEAMIKLRRVPEWSQWFRGKIGAVTKRRNPVERALFYEHYIQLKKLWKDGVLSDAEFLVIALHIACGCREGWTNVSESDDLDSQNVRSSLVGLKWENIAWTTDSCIINIYESKTEKWWKCDPKWLDAEIVELLKKYAKEKGSIIKTITGIETVGEFQRWYVKLLKQVSELLNLPYTLKPHDLRRSHISILAELGVPMEYAISGYMDFGVGWEDAKTALMWYLRFSKLTKHLLMQKIEETKKKILEMSV